MVHASSRAFRICALLAHGASQLISCLGLEAKISVLDVLPVANDTMINQEPPGAVVEKMRPDRGPRHRWLHGQRLHRRVPYPYQLFQGDRKSRGRSTCTWLDCRSPPSVSGGLPETRQSINIGRSGQPTSGSGPWQLGPCAVSTAAKSQPTGRTLRRAVPLPLSPLSAPGSGRTKTFGSQA